MTIKDIAREAGCAVGTVSRVLNNHPDVSEKTREHVLAVVNRHGFALNRNARQLKAQDSRTIAVLVKGRSSSLLNDLLGIIQNRLEVLPYSASVSVLDEYDNEALEALRIYYEQKPLGMMFLGGNPDLYKDDFAKISVPCVLVSNAAEYIENSNLSSISTDDVKAAECSAEYLVQNGHRRIGVIGGDIESSAMTAKRYRGFLNVMERYGIEFDYEKSYVRAKYSYEGGAAAARALMLQNPDVTAVFTMSDVMAIGAIRSLTDSGYSIPEQISVIGYDGLSVGGYFIPRLTTIRQNESELADGGLNILLDCIERKSASVHKLIPFTFVEGESVRHL